METHRLKHITIVILLLLNLFLLALLLNFRWQQAKTSRALSEELYELYETSGVSLAEDLELQTPSLQSKSVSRDLEMEAAIAEQVLGESVQAVHQGGGIYTYTGTAGTIRFRSSGAFDFVSDRRSVEDPAAFFSQFCEDFGYEEQTDRNGTDAFSAVRMVEGNAVYNCTVTIRFSGNQLVSASGTCVSVKDSAPLAAVRFNAADALVRFLGYREESGAICSSVMSVTPVYELQTSTASPMQLASRWQILTNTYSYYVDPESGTVTRA